MVMAIAIGKEEIINEPNGISRQRDDPNALCMRQPIEVSI